MSTKKTVLIIDDNPVMRKLVCVALGIEGYKVMEAANAGTALESLSQGARDRVLQNWTLPDMPGTELIRRLRALPAGAKIPILAVSGFGAMAGVAQNPRLGFTEVLAKPISPSRLVEIVQHYLGATPAGPAPPVLTPIA